MTSHLLAFAAGVGVYQSPAASQAGEARGAAGITQGAAS